MNLLLNYLSLCLFRQNPINLIPGPSFVMKNLAFYLVSGMIVEGLISDPVSGTLEVLMRTIMAFSFITVFLLTMKKWQFFKQVFTAIFVCENFIITLAIVAEVLDVVMVMRHVEYQEEISIGINVFLVGWYIAVISYIFRQVFLYTATPSVISAIAYFIASYGIPMLVMEL